MSKRDKPNRFSEKPHFEELRPIGDANKTASVTPPKAKPVVYDPDEDEASPLFNFGGVSAFLGRCRETLTTFSKSAVAQTWGGCRSVVQWTWIGLRKIPSYCVIRWDADDVEAQDEPAKKPDSAATEFKNTVVPSGNTKKPATENNEFDDELAVSPLWSLGTKAASVAAALLILGGGYFAVTPLIWKTPTEVAESAEATEENLAAPEQSVALLPPETAIPVAETAALERKPERPEPARSKPAIVTAPVPPRQPETVATAQNLEPIPSSQGTSPTQGSPLNNDPFALSAVPTVADAAPPIANDPFGSAPGVSAPPAPSVPSAPHAPKNSTQNLTALQPLSPLDSASTSQPQLQPLVALDSSPLRPLTASAAPVAVEGTASSQVASRYNSRQARQTQRRNPEFGAAPTPPVVNAMPGTTAQQTMAVVEPMREIVPQIPPSGTVQAVPPPPVPPTPPAAEVSSARSVYAHESAPAIPKDAPIAAPSVPVVAVVVPVPVVSASESTPQIESATSQLMDGQLWEQLREWRESEPSNLRLNETIVDHEPALRFTPNSLPLATTETTLLHEGVNQFRPLILDELDPNSGDLETRLPSLERMPAPQPTYDVVQPKYRKNQSGSERSGESGMTFRNRIHSEITRSPSAMERYTLQPGDTYMTISDKFYGTSLLYSALAEHNRALGIGWNPAEGVVIEIPPAEYLRTYYHPQRRLGSQRPAVRYIVQEGDTIFRLATDKLQDTNRWREIYAMNSDRIQNVHDLKPGMEILLPAESARTNGQQM